MTLKKCGALALSVAFCSYCYSEIVHETSQNAAIDAQQWVMTNVLPGYMGLTVNSISYQYTAVKETQDAMLVSIQNQQAGGAGYVFRSVDDWTGLPGNTIRKSVPVGAIPYESWGAGEISIEGTGSVIDPNIQYNYSYDPCASDALSSPSCPGYAAALAARYAAQASDTEQQDYSISSSSNTVLPDYYDEENASSKDPKQMDEEQSRERKRLGLKASENALTQANQISQSQILEAMNYSPQFQSYYIAAISGGVYSDAPMYKPTTVPENRNALRVGLAQQIMHNKMIDEQYNRK